MILFTEAYQYIRDNKGIDSALSYPFISGVV